ncbi:NAD(P)/FAD-dependent oxidoreductase [Luteococcus sediminum]
MTDHDVIVVGAGLAGLACARALREHDLRPVVLESQGRVGGRATSDEVDGFVVERGFQVLNPAYPHLRATGVVGQLGLQSFPRSVRVRHAGRLDELTDPTRHPASLPGDLRTGLVGARDVALARVATRLVGADRRRGDAFDAAGFTGPLRHKVVDPFLAGVLCEDDGSTSARFTAWLASMFLLGTPGLPTGGMRRLGEALAEGLDVRLDHPVTGIDTDDGHVKTPHGNLTGRAVVLAAGPVPTADLAGQGRPSTHPTTTWWFATEQAPSPSGAIHVDGEQSGPIVTTSVVSHAAPDHAPAGQHLVAALTLADGEVDEQAVRAHASHIYGIGTEAWRTLAVHHIPHSLPTVAPGQFAQDRIGFQGEAVLCGDQFGNASIDGAIASGRAAAAEVARRLGAR